MYFHCVISTTPLVQHQETWAGWLATSNPESRTPNRERGIGKVNNADQVTKVSSERMKPKTQGPAMNQMVALTITMVYFTGLPVLYSTRPNMNIKCPMVTKMREINVAV